ncbi:MAG: lysylphosphatidylglycerol synthase transmembrane domain-containing protein [Blastocatellales bacterium]
MDQQISAVNVASVAFTNPTEKPPAAQRLKPLLAYLFAGVGLAWVLHDIRLEQLPSHFVRINWSWVALAIVCDILGYVCQGVRWQLLLQPVSRKLSWPQATQAVYAGLFVNEILPLRAGELVRAWLAARWMSVSPVSIIPSIVVERLLDAIWLVAGIGLVAVFVPLPQDLTHTGSWIGIIIIVSVVCLIALFMVRRQIAHSERMRGRLAQWKSKSALLSLVVRLAGGLREIGLSRPFYFSLIISLVFLALQGLAFWLVMLAYGLPLSWQIGMAVFLIVHVGTLIPNAPANVGSYQFFCVVGLTLFGVDKTLATGFSLVVFISLTVPLLVIGWLALGRSGMKLRTIHQESC